MTINNEIKSHDDSDMTMLPPWVPPLVLAFCMVAGLVTSNLQNKSTKPSQAKPVCHMHVASVECK